MKICIKNCILISMEEEREKIEYNIDILIKDNKIIEVGKNLDTEKVDKIIDASNKVVMPGLINTHAHVPMSIFRETLDGYTLQDWLSKKIWPMEDKLNDKDVYYASYLSFIEMIKTGTTTVNDMYFITDSIIKAALDTGVRMQTSRCLMNHDGKEGGKTRLQEQEELLKNYKEKYDKITFNMGVHSLYTCNGEYVDECLNVAEKNDIPIHMHFCENATELQDIKRIHGKTPIEVIKEKFNDKKMLLAHCVKLSKEDIDEISNMDVSIAHCPVSNLKLGCGIAKIKYMQEKGINITLGTDGQGSGCNLDLFETMKYTALLQKGAEEDPNILPAYDVLKMATINGAKALGLEDNIGSIKAGKIADIIIIDIDDIKIKPINNLISELVYNVKGNNVITSIIDGKILMEDRKLINMNEDMIAKNCEETIKRINT